MACNCGKTPKIRTSTAKPSSSLRGLKKCPQCSSAMSLRGRSWVCTFCKFVINRV